MDEQKRGRGRPKGKKNTEKKEIKSTSIPKKSTSTSTSSSLTKFSHTTSNSSYDNINSPFNIINNGEINYNGEKYNGTVDSNNIPNGCGTLTKKNGEVYAGEWKNGFKNGTGTMTLPTGYVYVGTWKNDKMNGEFKVITYYGEEKEEHWVDGEKI